MVAVALSPGGDEYPGKNTPRVERLVRAADDDGFTARVDQVTYDHATGYATLHLVGDPDAFYPKRLLCVNPPRFPHLQSAEHLNLVGDTDGRISIAGKVWAQVVSKTARHWQIRLTPKE